MKLHKALGIVRGDIVAFVGAGGKSSAIVTLAGELVADGMKVLAVPTTKMFVEEAERIGALVTAGDPAELRSLVAGAFKESPAVVAGSGTLSKGRIAGVEPGAVEDLASLADVTLVEADGARRRPLKGTADHEPALPASATLVVAVGSIRALGMPLTEDNVHRPAVFSKLTGISPGHSITARAFARALAQGSLRELPGKARGAALLTGVEPGRSMSDASIVTRELWRFGVQKVVFASLPRKGSTQVWIP